MKDRETVTDILKDLAEGSSLHGIPKIVSSKQRPIKALWCLLFAATFTVLTIQMYVLFTEFLSHPIKTTVSLRFNPLPFPAITFCNMNPVKLSHVNKYPKLEEIIHDRQKIVKPNERKKRQAGTARATSTLSGTASEPSISITSPSAVDTERTTAASREIPMDPDLDTSTKTVATTKDIEAAEKDYNDYNSYDNEYVETDYVEAETDYNDYNSNGTDNAKTDYSNNNNSGTEDAETDYSDDNSNDNGNYNDNTDYETDYWGNYDGYGGYGESDYEDDTYEEYYDFSDFDDYFDENDYYDDDFGSYYDSRMQQIIDSFIKEQLSSPKDKWDERRVSFRAKYKNETL